MAKVLTSSTKHRYAVLVALVAWQLCQQRAVANPTGGTVTQGAATISSSGSQLTITTSGNTAINWQGFNIGVGETTTFVQPSSTSVAWNYINSGSPSQILGNLNANGYVVLQNASGFYIGGQAVISTHGLVLTTAPINMPNLTSGGAWQFDAPPPTAKIINYGQINIAGGGSAFLLANDIENNGTISAPGGNIGLYAGEKVLVSQSPDGRSLSAEVTLPQGSVDNEGKLIADAGSIAAQAQMVNQNGLVQANSVQNVNGVIELVASDSLTLGASSKISAQGDDTSSAPSPGGFVVLQSGNTYADTASSTISVAGQGGGQDGVIEMFGNGAMQSSLSSYYALLVNPYNLTLSANGTDTSSSNPNLNVNDLSAYAQIDLHALNNIEISADWVLPNLNSPSTLSLAAGNNIIMDDNSALTTYFAYNGSAGYAGYDWNLNLTAGTSLSPGNIPVGGNDGIYLNGDSYIQTYSGNINLWAANEVAVTGDVNLASYFPGGITTFGGGNINVTAQYGDVNTGANIYGYDFGLSTAPYYAVDPYLGGISTAAGGNVTIKAGGDVISYLPTENDFNNPLLNVTSVEGDAGSGAFGPQPGNVTIMAGGNVYGHYVVANGVGTITAGGNVGVPLTATDQSEGFALSLIKGSWSVYAPNGSIYVQDINNPNGIFGDSLGTAGYHYFDYDPASSVLLDAGNSVEITGNNAPQAAPTVSDLGASIPMILPPSLDVITGPAGDFTLDTSVILFPSPDQNLNLDIGGNFIGVPNADNSINPNIPNAGSISLEMSDSAALSWVGNDSFSPNDHASTPPEVDNPNPVGISVGGNMENLNLYATKMTQMSVGGDIINSGFIGENLHASDVTSITVGGSIQNSPLYSFAQLSSPIVSANPLQPSTWDSIFDLAVNPGLVSALTSLDARNVGVNGLAYYLNANGYLLFPSGTGSSIVYGSNPGFVYDANSQQLGFKGSMSRLSAAQINALETGSITVLVANAQGIPIIDANGHLETKTYTFGWGSVIASLDSSSLNNTLAAGAGFQIGGPGQFNIQAASINLGNSAGIVSYGFGSGYGPNYSSLEGLCGVIGSGGAAVNVTVTGDLDMLTSQIASIDGGDVTINVGGSINLSEGTFTFPTVDCYGIWTSGHSDVNVTANGDINVGSARIATFNGGNVTVTSNDGDVNCGNGVNLALQVYGIYLDPVTGLPVTGQSFGDLADAQSLQVDSAPYGSGILAEYPTKKYQTPGGSGQPGNITINTPKGNIISSLGGISQFALDGNIDGGPTINLSAGTPGVVATPDQGNIILGQGGVIGGTVNITAQGDIQGLIVSRQDANINTPQNISVTVLSGGTANANAGGSVSGTLVGIGGVSASGGGGVSATMLSQNVSVGGGTSQSTLGTSASATSTSQAAAQQSTQAAAQQVADNGNNGDDDDKKKKKQPVLQRSKRVTVLLSEAAPNKTGTQVSSRREGAYSQAESKNESGL